MKGGNRRAVGSGWSFDPDSSDLEDLPFPPDSLEGNLRSRQEARKVGVDIEGTRPRGVNEGSRMTLHDARRCDF
jgi:hypothetical protein